MMPSKDENWSESLKQPFRPEPVSGNGLDVDAAIRLAAAAEFIAGQIGMMNAKLDKVIEELAKLRGGSPA